MKQILYVHTENKNMVANLKSQILPALQRNHENPFHPPLIVIYINIDTYVKIINIITKKVLKWYLQKNYDYRFLGIF